MDADCVMGLEAGMFEAGYQLADGETGGFVGVVFRWVGRVDEQLGVGVRL